MMGILTNVLVSIERSDVWLHSQFEADQGYEDFSNCSVSHIWHSALVSTYSKVNAHQKAASFDAVDLQWV
jgi:hypothetical protein